MKRSTATGLLALSASIALLVVLGGEALSETNYTPLWSLDRIIGHPDYVDLETIQEVVIDLKYASTDNFMGENVYGDFRKAFLHKVAAAKLQVAVDSLKKLKPGWKLVVFDALRPRSVQRQFWDRVRGTPLQPYVANPDKGSMHNFGFAVDVSLLDKTGREVDMGSRYDDFSKLSEPRLEESLLKAGKLTESQVNHRRVLRKVMAEAGFAQQPNEWWHFDALPAAEVYANYTIVE